MKVLSIAAGIAGAISMAQFPAISQDYVQRLAGAVDELSVVVADFDRSADRAGLSRTEALASMEGNAFLQNRQGDMSRAITRYEALSDDLGTLRDAGPFGRLARAPRLADPELLQRTLDDYEPAVPVTIESAGFAGMGYLAGWGLLAGLIGLARFGWRRFRAPEPTA